MNYLKWLKLELKLIDLFEFLSECSQKMGFGNLHLPLNRVRQPQARSKVAEPVARFPSTGTGRQQFNVTSRVAEPNLGRFNWTNCLIFSSAAIIITIAGVLSSSSGSFAPPPPLFVQLSRIDFIFTWNKYDYRRNYFSGKIRAGASRRWDSFHIFLISSGGLKYSTLSLISKQKTHTNQLIKIMEEVCWYWPGVVGKWQWGQPMKSMVTSQIRTDNWIEPTAVWNEPHSQSMNKNPERNMLRGCDNNTHTHTC